jgi:hypothetical protein
MVNDLFIPTEPKPNTQHYQILEYLRRGNRLTGLDALKIVGTMKLASRISELKRMGHYIKSETIKVDSGKHVKIYWI